MSRRHPWLDRTCAMLERIVWGEAAERALANLPEGHLDLLVMPVWGWAHSRIDVGRKDLDPLEPGQRLLMHVRLDYDTTPVVVLTSATALVHASGVGLGHVISFDVPLDRDCTQAPVIPDGHLDATGPWGPQVRGRARTVARLHELVADGRAAGWDMYVLLESRVRWALTHAHASMASRAGGPLIDETTIETLVTRLVLGDETTSGSSRIQRLVQRCTHPTAFARVDVERLLTVSLRRDAGEEVRRALGDPAVGDRVRRVAAQLRASGDRPGTVEELMSAYRREYPGSHVSTGRIAAAMTMGPLLEAIAVPLDDGFAQAREVAG